MRGVRVPSRAPAPVASLPLRGLAKSVHFSMARSVHFSMAIDSRIRTGLRQPLQPVRHEFTHRRVTYAAFRFEVSEVGWLPDVPGPHRWVSRA